MATVVNNPGTTTDSGGAGFLMGAILLIAVLVLLFYFGLPALRGGGVNQSPTINLPESGQGAAPNIQVPDKVDVNLNQGQ